VWTLTNLGVADYRERLVTKSNLFMPEPAMRIVAAIPAYNEEDFIEAVVSKASRYVDEVIVVDDGSTDNTFLVAQRAGATVVRHELNRGVGQATRTCFELARRKDIDVLVTIDGDGQHNPDEIPQLLAPVIENGADLVIGSRFLDGRCIFPRYRKFGISIITFLLNLSSRSKISDSQSCYRAYSKRALNLLTVEEKGFPFSIELLVKARRKGLNIREVPISCVYHSRGHTINPVIHGLRVAISVLRLRAKAGYGLGV
jgi:glycosyltransferase involved in cell wall biosynthesis